MAYLNFLASVSENNVFDFQNNNSALQASKVVQVSHLVAYWVTVQPLGKTLGEAIGGGDILNSKISHPFRAPLWHNADSAKKIANKLQSAWKKAIEEHGEAPEDDWYRIEIEKVLSVFQHATNQDEAVISFLDINNFDVEKNRRVKIPIELKY